MKILGMVGGIGPEATVDYYRLLVAAYREQVADGSYPPIVINSINMEKLRRLTDEQKYPELVAFVVEELERLARAGAELGFLSANSPHIMFDEIQRRSPFPLISIVEATCEAAHAMGLRRLGLLGTRFTMSGRFFPEVFERRGIDLAVPPPEEQNYIHEIYFGELVKGVFKPETKTRLIDIVQKLKANDQIEAVILGGTELPLILTGKEEAGLPLLDTTRIHVQAIVARWLM